VSGGKGHHALVPPTLVGKQKRGHQSPSQTLPHNDGEKGGKIDDAGDRRTKKSSGALQKVKNLERRTDRSRKELTDTVSRIRYTNGNQK